MRSLKALLFILFSLNAVSQTYSGHIKDQQGNVLVGVNIFHPTTETGSSSNAKGYYEISLPEGSQGSLIFSMVGFQSQRIEIAHASNHLDITLKEDYFGLEEVLVTGNRQGLKRNENPVIVASLNSALFNDVAALSLAEGLSFSPGLRIENNCQNCGFTQLRINGLDGGYSQILLNSRPIFSGLMAVYGLEMIPSNMIERVEVVRGGGSALYGGNAIGGTVNIITKEPHATGFNWHSQVQNIAGEAWEQSHSLGISLASDDQKTGLQAFAFNRNREAWDANNDGFTEITSLENLSLGASAFWKTNSRSKLSFDLYSIQEFRRGGSDLDLLPHQSRIAEQLEHQVHNLGLAWEALSEDGKHFYSIYSSLLSTNRDSYYGAGGRIIDPQDSLNEQDLLALNAYGNTTDLNWVSGAQYVNELSEKAQFSLGLEYQNSRVNDEMPGYRRLINQNVSAIGAYTQTQYDLTDKLRLQGGIRFDFNYLRGSYYLLDSLFSQDRFFRNFSPRLNLQYKLADNWQIRASYARGFRIPQAFNEDLHIETVGGAALFIQLDENLEAELSNSLNLSNEILIINSLSEHQVLVSGFHTQLLNPFVLVDRKALANGTSVQIKENGDQARVQGFNIEYQGAWNNGLQIQMAITGQESVYKTEQSLWSSENPENPKEVRSQRFLRTPNWYGYLQGSFQSNNWQFAAALNYTGEMLLARLKNAETEEISLINTPSFWDLQLSTEYTWKATENYSWKFKLGVKNLFDAFQQDLPIGEDRDASYIYGPILPRTYYLSIKLDLVP